MLCYVFLLFSFILFSESAAVVNHNVQTCQVQQYLFNWLPGDIYNPMARCPLTVGNLRNTIYLLYDVNPPEGFNLRRDVYIRLAVFVQQLQKRQPFGNIRLVLPPWRRLFHWKSFHLQQDSLPWQTFFDIESMRRFASILDFPEFLEEISTFGLPETPYVNIHQILQLVQFEEMFDNGVFHDKFEFDHTCRKDKYIHGYVLEQPQLLDNEFSCLRFQGTVNLLERVLRIILKQFPFDEVKVITLLNAETVLHDHWGDASFWRARRSMRFSSTLMQKANEFRLVNFNATNASDKVQRPSLWEYERPYRGALGGPYLCAHLRRGDFVHGRDKTTPTLKSAATQIKQQLQALNLSTVYLATDATAFEFMNLKSYLQRVRVKRFIAESLEQKASLKDGGIAIIDQLICSHARYFIGTYESTFTYRIYEEREILGFSKSTTFNTFCKNSTLNNCSKNSVWPIAY